jgi:threonine/homoserine/homoserine lactone efflux protein
MKHSIVLPRRISKRALNVRAPTLLNIINRTAGGMLIYAGIKMATVERS